MKKLILTIIIFLAVSVISLAQIGEVKILSSDGAEDDNFGHSVSISGDYVIVGVPNDDDNGMTSGSVYIFKRDGTNWAEEQKLTASDGAEVDMYGYSVSISGDYALVGVPGDKDYGDYTGSAYVLKREGISWVEKQKLIASDAEEDDHFGWSVAISEEYAVIGAVAEATNGHQSGAAYIFKREGDSWLEKQKLIASDGTDNEFFGWEVAISKDFVVIGCPEDEDNGSDAGAVYIYNRVDTSWLEMQKLLASDGAGDDNFGRSVSISNNYIVVGSPFDDDKGNRSGSAYMFKLNGSNWIEEQKLTASNGSEHHNYGTSVSIYGQTAIVGTWIANSVYLYKFENFNWIEDEIIVPSDGTGSEQFGTSISLDYNKLISGARGDDDNGTGSGSAYINFNFIVGVENEQLKDPLSYNLNQNYPNPFNPTTSIKYKIPEFNFVTLKIYDVLGNEIITLVNEEKPVGSYKVELNATSLPSGIYFYRLQAGSFVETKKMVFLK